MRTTRSTPFPIAPNLLARDFTASASDRALATDITFVWTAQGWLYLAVILDLFSLASPFRWPRSAPSAARAFTPASPS